MKAAQDGCRTFSVCCWSNQLRGACVRPWGWSCPGWCARGGKRSRRWMQCARAGGSGLVRLSQASNPPSGIQRPGRFCEIHCWFGRGRDSTHVVAAVSGPYLGCLHMHQTLPGIADAWRVSVLGCEAFGCWRSRAVDCRSAAKGRAWLSSLSRTDGSLGGRQLWGELRDGLAAETGVFRGKNALSCGFLPAGCWPAARALTGSPDGGRKP